MLMSNNKNTFTIYLKDRSLATNIKNYFNISYRDAVKLLYHFRIYKSLDNEGVEMWYYSSYHLFKMFLE